MCSAPPLRLSENKKMEFSEEQCASAFLIQDDTFSLFAL